MNSNIYFKNLASLALTTNAYVILLCLNRNNYKLTQGQLEKKLQVTRQGVISKNLSLLIKMNAVASRKESRLTEYQLEKMYICEQNYFTPEENRIIDYLLSKDNQVMLSPTCYRIIFALASNREPVSQTELCNMYNFKKSVVSKAFKRMSALKMIVERNGDKYFLSK